jgi:hypothetical protein
VGGRTGFGCGVLVVSLWWMDGANVVFRRVFFRGENYANFSDLFGVARVAYDLFRRGRSVVRASRECPHLKIEIWGTRFASGAQMSR